MAQATYRQIGGPGGLLARKQPFQGNSMSAVLLPDTGLYLVFSYNTQIAAVTADGEKVVSDDYYSVTTSRQQNLCRAWL